MEYDRAGPNDGVVPNANTLNDRCTNADERTRFNRDAPGELCSRADVTGGTDHALVVYDAPSIQNHAIADLAMGTD